jgi:hypothetical protein
VAVDEETEWAYRFLIVELADDADAEEQTEAVNNAWELIADELWSPQIVSFQTATVGDQMSLVILYRYDDSDEDEDEEE